MRPAGAPAPLRAWPALALALLVAAPAAAANPEIRCLRASGKATLRCLERTLDAVEGCRRRGDAPCEEALRAEGGALEALLAEPDAPIAKRCGAEDAVVLGYTSLGDVALRAREACTDFAEEHLDLTWVDDVAALGPDDLACQGLVAKELGKLRRKAVAAFGRKCALERARGRTCKTDRRDVRLGKLRARTLAKLASKCSLPELTDDLEARVDAILLRAEHLGLRAYPPNDLGPAADFGPFPIGVRTLELADPARGHVDDPLEPRPVRVEIYYPSTAEAVEGLPGDVVQVFAIPVVETPAFRDVAIAPGTFPIVLFSHGNGGIRFQSFFFAAHLASHGFVVLSPDHHGNNLIDAIAGVEDADAALNRPLDMSFLIDQAEALSALPGGLFEGALDTGAIGMSGHSFGGYTALALAGGLFSGGTFTDPRIRAILPQAPASGFFDDGFFATITIPTLIVGGSIDATTPFATDQQRAFDLMEAGASPVALAGLEQAGHFTFSDFCEVPREILAFAFADGFAEACEPRHLPWRHAHDIVNFLSLHFFDATLRGSAAALAELEANRLAAIEGLTWQAK